MKDPIQKYAFAVAVAFSVLFRDSVVDHGVVATLQKTSLFFCTLIGMLVILNLVENFCNRRHRK